jgi:hypothetical protein
MAAFATTCKVNKTFEESKKKEAFFIAFRNFLLPLPHKELL